MNKTFKAYYEGYNFIGIVLLLAVLLSFFYSCNVVNKSRSVEKKSIDSTTTLKLDSSKLLSNDSTSVKKETAVDSSKHKHIDSKKLIINFDTNTPTIVNPDSSYHYLIDGKKITTPNRVKSAEIDDSNEDDSSEFINHNKSDSVKVISLDTGHVKKDGNTHVQEQTKNVNTAKESKRTSPWFIGSILILVIIAGYVIGRKIGFFK